MTRAGGIFAVALLVLARTVAAEPEPAGRRYLLELELSALQSSARGRAEVLAGARLLMSSRRSPAGGLTLAFERALEDPWKLFHLDPIGPFGGQTKAAAVITLPEASWDALDERRAAHARAAARRHAGWRPAAGRKPPLDGAFAFIVIGDPIGRFNLEIAAGGERVAVENRMTDRWLNGDFGRFVGDWGPTGARPGAPRGYWFWNDGETEPFSWQPGTYRALAAAVELLGRAPADGIELVRRAERVIEALAPRAPGRRAPSWPPLTLEEREEIGADGETIVVSQAKKEEVAVVRRLTLGKERLVVADSLLLEVDRVRSGLRLAVGYRPAKDGEEDKPGNI